MEAPKIAGCPSSPNCVSSRAQDPAHQVNPMPFDMTPEGTWERVKQVLAQEPRLQIVEERKESWYLRAVATSRVFGFADDVEFQLDPDQKLLHMRSASRVGYWDLGVNRRRIERLQEALRALGLSTK